MSELPEPTLDALLHENRTFPPPASFTGASLLTDRRLHDAAAADRLGFWAAQSRALVDWINPFSDDAILDWQLPFARWFHDGTLNVSANCLDRHVAAGRGERVAFHWEGEPGDTRSITYADLLDEVQRLSAALRDLGVRRGDRVAIYLPMIPEATVAMLACTRIGAAHSVVFGGFSSESLRDRINDASAVAVITADGGYRRGAASALKPNVDAALAGCPTVHSVVVVDRCGLAPTMQAGRDVWYHDLLQKFPTGTLLAPEAMNAEDRRRMIQTMVDGLEEKLKADGSDIAGWQRLIRARMVLGQREQAKVAYRAARELFKDKPDVLASFEGLAKELGVE